MQLVNVLNLFSDKLEMKCQNTSRERERAANQKCGEREELIFHSLSFSTEPEMNIYAK